MGIRQKVAIEFGSTPDKNGKLGRQHSEDVVVTPIRSSNYFNELGNSIFCGVFPGDGWSGRLEDCIMQGSIPVIVQVNIHTHITYVHNSITSMCVFSGIIS